MDFSSRLLIFFCFGTAGISVCFDATLSFKFDGVRFSFKAMSKRGVSASCEEEVNGNSAINPIGGVKLFEDDTGLSFDVVVVAITVPGASTFWFPVVMTVPGAGNSWFPFVMTVPGAI